MATTHLKNYIDGRWVDSASGDAFEDLDPATGEVIATATKSTVADIDKAVEAAHRASDAWRLFPAPKRGEILYRAGEIMLRRKDELARDMTREMGKVLAEARGDVQEGIDMTYYTAGEGRRLFADRRRILAAIDGAMREAALTKLIVDFAAGRMSYRALRRRMVVRSPMLAVRLIEILEEAGIPKGVVNLVLGPGGEIGDHLVTHPLVDLVSFTGSSDAGAHISEIAGRQLKRVSAELGGKNAIVVLDDADIDLSIEGILWSAFGTSGQRCTAASRVIAHKGVANAVIDKLVGRAKKMKMGHGLEPSTDLGPVVSKQAQEKVASYMPIAEKEGATIAVGGRIPTDGALAKGFFHEPTVLVDVKPNMRVAQEEIFGPVTAVIEVSGLDEAIKVLNSTKYGLSCSVYTRNVNNAFRFMRDAETGLVYVNAGTIGAEIQLPFGGMKSTGNGHREAGRAALDVYSEWKSIYVDFSGKLQRAQMDATTNPAP